MLEIFINKKNCPYIFLEANPHYYDYLHVITLCNDGTMEFTDGGGQSIYGRVEGNFKIEKLERGEFRIRFFNLVLIDPEERNKILTKIDAFAVIGRISEVTFTFKLFNDESTFDKMIEFDFDPFMIFRENCASYPSSYTEDEDEELIEELRQSSPNLAKNGLYFNELTRTFFLDSNMSYDYSCKSCDYSAHVECLNEKILKILNENYKKLKSLFVRFVKS